MAITTAIANSFKQEALDGVHEAGDVYKFALIKSGHAGVFNKATTNYSDLGADEVANGNGYATGGQVLAGRISALTGDVANVTWTDPLWDPATISADGGLIYNSSQGNKAVMTVSFGGTVISTAGPFTADLPATGAAALLRIN